MKQIMMCDICPFGKSKKALKHWPAGACDQIEECAAVLLKEDGLNIPHPCFKFSKAADVREELRAATPNEPPCIGHKIWLSGQTLLRGKNPSGG